MWNIIKAIRKVMCLFNDYKFYKTNTPSSENRSVNWIYRIAELGRSISGFHYKFLFCKVYSFSFENSWIFLKNNMLLEWKIFVLHPNPSSFCFKPKNYGTKTSATNITHHTYTQVTCTSETQFFMRLSAFDLCLVHNVINFVASLK